MLEHVDARELGEWRAYEVVHGPVDGQWRDEAMASMHEVLQGLRYFAGAHFAKKGSKNPAPDPYSYPRPSQMYEYAKKRAHEKSNEEEKMLYGEWES